MPRTVEEPAPRRSPPYFWWLLANGLALCFAVLSWAICLHVFGNPEIPRNYELLRKIKRLPQLERYTVLDVPDGDALGPKQLYSRFIDPKILSDGDLAILNSRFLRNYITNFDHPLLLSYVEGDYEIVNTRLLQAGDFIDSGIAVRARAVVKPDDFSPPAHYPVVVEYLFPTVDTSLAAKLRPGDLLSVRKSPNCAALLNAGRRVEGDESIVVATVVPIAYGPYRIGEGLSLSVEPPAEVNPRASLPVFDE